MITYFKILFLFVLLLILLQFFLKKLKDLHEARKKIASWMPAVTGLPILGPVFEFGGPTDVLHNIINLLKNPGKSVFADIGGQWKIFTQDNELSEFILSSNNDILDKSVDYEFLKPWLGNGLLTSTGEKWKTHRRAIIPSFKLDILQEFVEVFNSNADILVEKLILNAYSGKINIRIDEFLTSCTLDIICECAMGINTKSKTKENLEYEHAAKKLCVLHTKRMFSFWKWNNFLYKFSHDYRAQTKNLTIIHNFTDLLIKQRKQELEDKNNGVSIKNNNKHQDDGKRKLAFLDLLLNLRIGDCPLTDEEIREQVDTLVVAGHDTVASTLCFTIHELAKNPRIQDLIREELKKVFGKKRDSKITYEDLHELRYLELVIKESLRMYPSPPFVGRLIKKDLNYKGHIIPKNTNFIIFTYGIHHDPDYYDDPELFKPERFLEPMKKRFSYIPFGAGPRICIGQKFAMLELKTVLAKILMNFIILPSSPPEKLILSTEIGLKIHNGVNVRLQECDWN